MGSRSTISGLEEGSSETFMVTAVMKELWKKRKKRSRRQVFVFFFFFTKCTYFEMICQIAKMQKLEKEKDAYDSTTSLKEKEYS